MAVVAGGSGSTGSTVLRTVLNRHPKLFSGTELSLFNKELYYRRWTKYRRYLLAFLASYRGVRATHGWMPHPGHKLLHPNYGWPATELLPVVRGSGTLAGFAREFFARPLDRVDAEIWIEKTPSNCYCFPRFLDAFEDGRVIHTSRNPLDAVASLVLSGMDPFWASCRWIYCTASSLRVRESERYLMIDYDTLVADPEAAIRQVTRHIGVDFLPTMLEPGSSDTNEYQREPGWTFDRTDRIQKPKVRASDRIDDATRSAVRSALTLARVSAKHVEHHGLDHRSCEDSCATLGYDYEEVRASEDEMRGWLPRLRKLRRRDMADRTLRGYPTHAGFYPIALGTEMDEPRRRPMKAQSRASAARRAGRAAGSQD